MKQIRVGTTVTVESTTGQATGSPKTATVTGKVYRDCEGTLRVENVNVTRDANGYFPYGVVVVKIGK